MSPIYLHREAKFAIFYIHALHEWAWLRAHMYVTTITRFAKKASLLTLYGFTMHIATLKPDKAMSMDLALLCEDTEQV